MAYPIDERNEWKYKRVENLMGGLNYNASADQIADNQAIILNNVELKVGAVYCDSGYSTFGSTIVGQPQRDYEFQRQSGTVQLVLVTTSTFYFWNDSLLKWLLARGTECATPQGRRYRQVCARNRGAALLR